MERFRNSAYLMVLAILLATVAMFLWGRWRHDMVAGASLLACVLTGLVPSSEAFAGFGHPAVITVACVLVLSHGLQNTGAVDVLARYAVPAKAGPTLTIGTLTALAAAMSGFMNNVGALALLMPVALQVARRLDLPPGKALMPLAFGSILGGMTTLIGTPPNLIVSGFRTQAGLATFGMFDFTPVGAAVMAAGVLFVALIGWRLVPTRKQASIEGFETSAYLTEARVAEDSKADGKTLREIESALDEAGAQVVGLVRNEVRVTAPSPGRVVRAGDILVIEAEAEALSGALSSLGLKLEEAKTPAKDDGEDGRPAADERAKDDEEQPDVKQPPVPPDQEPDVVPVEDESQWTYPPFGGEIHEGRIWGRGASDMKGTVAAEATRTYPLLTPRPGWTEQRPSDWITAAIMALRDVAEMLGDREIGALSFSGQMHGMVALDAAGRVIRPAILWNDQRTGEAVREIEAAIPRADLIRRTGNRAATGFQLPKILWLRANFSTRSISAATLIPPSRSSRSAIEARRGIG